MAITASQVKELRERTGVGMLDCKSALNESNGDIDAAVEILRKKGIAKATKKEGRTASEGIIVAGVTDGRAVMLEVNCETDFVARDKHFIEFANQVLDRALHSGINHLEGLMTLRYGEDSETTIDDARKALILKIGENVNVRRIIVLGSEHKLATYLHGSRIGVLVELQGGDEALGKDLAMHIAASTPTVIDKADVPADLLEKERDIYLAQAQSSGKPQEILEKMVEGRLKKYVAEISLTGQPFVKDPNTTVEELLKKAQAKVLSFFRFEVGEGIEKVEKDFAQEVAETTRNI